MRLLHVTPVARAIPKTRLTRGGRDRLHTPWDPCGAPAASPASSQTSAASPQPASSTRTVSTLKTFGSRTTTTPYGASGAGGTRTPRLPRPSCTRGRGAGFSPVGPHANLAPTPTGRMHTSRSPCTSVSAQTRRSRAGRSAPAAPYRSSFTGKHFRSTTTNPTAAAREDSSPQPQRSPVTNQPAIASARPPTADRSAACDIRRQRGGCQKPAGSPDKRAPTFRRARRSAAR